MDVNKDLVVEGVPPRQLNLDNFRKLEMESEQHEMVEYNPGDPGCELLCWESLDSSADEDIIPCSTTTISRQSNDEGQEPPNIFISYISSSSCGLTDQDNKLAVKEATDPPLIAHTTIRNFLGEAGKLELEGHDNQIIEWVEVLAEVLMGDGRGRKRQKLKEEHIMKDKEEEEKSEKNKRAKKKRKRKEVEKEEEDEKRKRQRVTSEMLAVSVPRKEKKKNVSSAKNSGKPIKNTFSFQPFQAKDNMKLAPQFRTSFGEARRALLEQALEMDEDVEVSCHQFKGRSRVSGPTCPLIKDSLDNEVESIDEDDSSPMNEEDVIITTAVRQRIRSKLFRFEENRRPAYWRTWRKLSQFVGPRRPFGKEPNMDYEVDSDDEWEETAV